MVVDQQAAYDVTDRLRHGPVGSGRPDRLSYRYVTSVASILSTDRQASPKGEVRV